MKIKYILIAAVILLLALNCSDSTAPELEKESFSNGDFEEGTDGPVNWEIICPSWIADISWSWNEDTAYSGSKCMKSNRRSGFTFSLKHTEFRQLITDFKEGQTINFSAYVSTSNVGEGSAHIAIQCEDDEGEIIKYSAQNAWITDNTPWTQHTVSAKIPADTYRVYVTCVHDGSGTVYFDNCSVVLE